MALLSALLLACPVAQAAPLERPPNLVVVLVDDLGWLDHALELPGAPPAASRAFRTPNLRRLAEHGVVFGHAYAAAPVCTPTRVSLMTGRSPGATRVTYWTLHAGRDTSAAFEGLRPPAWQLDGLQPGAPTLASLLADAGYRTIHVGKAHFGARGTQGADPRALGFRVNIAGHAAGAPGSYRSRDGFRGEDEVWAVPGLSSWHARDVFLTEALAAEAVAALEDAADDGQPFFLHFAPYAVHVPIQANERLLEHYEGLDPREAAYATMVESVDEALGQLLDALERAGVADDTAVVFTSDNGGLAAHGRGGEPHTQNAPLRSGKGSYYEGGLRVPLVVRLPGARAARRDVHAPVVTYDLTPTLLALAGVDVPDDVAARFEGLDLGPLLRDEAQLPERALCWNQPHFWGIRGPGVQPFSAVRRGDWKLVWRHADRGFELYDLARDVGETHDLSADEPERVRSLAGDLEAWIERVGAQLSIDTDSGLEIERPLAVLERER